MAWGCRRKTRDGQDCWECQQRRDSMAEAAVEARGEPTTAHYPDGR